MIRIEPRKTNFLELKPKEIQCKIPPLNTFIELVAVTYLKPLVKYVTVNYNIPCRIVATGRWMYNDCRGSTELKTYQIVKTTNGFYFLVEPAEQHKYLIRYRNKSSMHLLAT